MTLWFFAIGFEVVGIAIVLWLIAIAPEMPNESHFNA